MFKVFSLRIESAVYGNFSLTENILHQSGNRKNHSTETLSLLVTDHIFRGIDQQQLTVMVLVDLSKASTLFATVHFFSNYAV